MRLVVLVLCITLFAIIYSSCGYLNASSDAKSYCHIGDIVFNPLEDDPDFKVCHPDKIFQYFNKGSEPEYMNEKVALDEYFSASYNPVELFEENGMIRIRFVGNCQGKADRFRMIASGSDYKEKVFDERITSQLMELTRSITEWPVKKYNKGDGDYYMYLIFKIRDGQLIEIMP